MRQLPHAIPIPLPPGFTPNAVKVEVVAWDENGRPVMFHGVVQIDRLEGILLRSVDEWPGYRDLTTQHLPLLEEDHGFSPGDNDDHERRT
jgi:hypothetical protein